MTKIVSYITNSLAWRCIKRFQIQFLNSILPICFSRITSFLNELNSQIFPRLQNKFRLGSHSEPERTFIFKIFSKSINMVIFSKPSGPHPRPKQINWSNSSDFTFESRWENIQKHNVRYDSSSLRRY